MTSLVLQTGETLVVLESDEDWYNETVGRLRRESSSTDESEVGSVGIRSVVFSPFLIVPVRKRKIFRKFSKVYYEREYKTTGLETIHGRRYHRSFKSEIKSIDTRIVF